jgi:hypothetical protein
MPPNKRGEIWYGCGSLEAPPPFFDQGIFIFDLTRGGVTKAKNGHNKAGILVESALSDLAAYLRLPNGLMIIHNLSARLLLGALRLPAQTPHGLENILIGTAATQITGKIIANFVLVRRWILDQEGSGR